MMVVVLKEEGEVMQRGDSESKQVVNQREMKRPGDHRPPAMRSDFCHA